MISQHISFVDIRVQMFLILVAGVAGKLANLAKILFQVCLLGGLGEQLIAIDINLHKLLHFRPSVLLLLLLEMGRPGHRKHGRTANREPLRHASSPPQACELSPLPSAPVSPVS